MTRRRPTLADLVNYDWSRLAIVAVAAVTPLVCSAWLDGRQQVRMAFGSIGRATSTSDDPKPRPLTENPKWTEPEAETEADAPPSR